MEKKEFIKKFTVVVEDLLDHYDEYTAEEKAQVQELFQKAAALNTILDKYDTEAKIDWQEFFIAAGQYFDNFHY